MEHNSIMPFMLMLAIGASVAAAIGLQMLAGFVVGVIVTLDRRDGFRLKWVAK